MNSAESGNSVETSIQSLDDALINKKEVKYFAIYDAYFAAWKSLRQRDLTMKIDKLFALHRFYFQEIG